MRRVFNDEIQVWKEPKREKQLPLVFFFLLKETEIIIRKYLLGLGL